MHGKRAIRVRSIEVILYLFLFSASFGVSGNCTSCLWVSSVMFSQPSLRKHAYSNMQKILPPKNENFLIKKSDIFHISDQNLDCGYSLGLPRQDGSNEYTQSMF